MSEVSRRAIRQCAAAAGQHEDDGLSPGSLSGHHSAPSGHSGDPGPAGDGPAGQGHRLVACYVTWHLQQRLAPMLFKDDDPPPAKPPSPARSPRAALTGVGGGSEKIRHERGHWFNPSTARRWSEPICT
jgi:hypothetical protein